MTVHSDWGDWLPNAVADAEPNGVDIWYLGCNGFILKANDGTTIFIDPFFGIANPPHTTRMIPIPMDPSDVKVCDAILATHEHIDHVHGKSQAPILEGTDADYYGPDDTLAVAIDDEAWPENYDISEDRFNEITEGDTLEIGSFSINVEGAYDPDSTHPVSYVIEHDAGTFYHGGDSKPGDVHEETGNRYDIDLGALAFGVIGRIPTKDTGELVQTEWYADENGVAQMASDLQLDRLLPSHWDIWKGLTADPKALHHHVHSYEYPDRLELVEIGDRVSL